MNCNVIRDLIILCADGGCSEESRRLVEEHIRDCEECKSEYEEMQAELAAETKPVGKPDTPPLRRVNDWKASVLQSAALFLSFALLVFGVAREAATPTGGTNGRWAVAVIVPTTGFLLSLANWYFVRLYPSRKSFFICSMLATLCIIVCGYVLAMLHYQNDWVAPLGGGAQGLIFQKVGIVLSVLFCALSGFLSNRYARMLGKE